MTSIAEWYGIRSGIHRTEKGRCDEQDIVFHRKFNDHLTSSESQHAGNQGFLLAQTEDGSADTLSVNIVANLLKRIELLPEFVTLSVGEKVTFKAQGYDAYGNPIGVRPFWHIVGEVGTISSITGTFVAKEVGEGYVVAFAQAIFGDTQTGVESTAKVV